MQYWVNCRAVLNGQVTKDLNSTVQTEVWTVFTLAHSITRTTENHVNQCVTAQNQSDHATNIST